MILYEGKEITLEEAEKLFDEALLVSGEYIIPKQEKIRFNFYPDEGHNSPRKQQKAMRAIYYSNMSDSGSFLFLKAFKGHGQEKMKI